MNLNIVVAGALVWMSCASALGAGTKLSPAPASPTYRRTSMGSRFLKIAVVYLFAGAVLGLIMGIMQQFVLAPVHAHLLLLGWASLALAGVIYHLYPSAATTLLARIHFWLHNLGLPAFMIALGMLLTGHESAGPAVAIAASVVLVALAIFAANVLLNVKPAA